MANHSMGPACTCRAVRQSCCTTFGKNLCLATHGTIEGCEGGELYGEAKITNTGTWSLGLVVVVTMPIVATSGRRSRSSQVAQLRRMRSMRLKLTITPPLAAVVGEGALPG